MGTRRFSRWLRVWAAFTIGACAAVWAPDACADDVADFLEQHGMRRLLAAHLEMQIEAAKVEDRGDLVLRLATLYAELLETTVDAAQRKDLEDRSRRLLEKAPPNSAEELRLALLRASYRAAEKIAENHRLRFASNDEVEQARKTLTEIIPQLNALRQRLKQDLELSDRRLARSSTLHAAALSEAGDRTRVLYSQCTFLTAWALYYQSWLNQRDDNARPAEALFGELLASESPSPEPADVSIDLRSTEAIARSILGMALCKSLTSSTATAINWVTLLEHQNTFDPLRAQATAWKIAIYLEHGEYHKVRETLQAQSDSKAVPLAWLRLVAVHALENSQRNAVADELARWSVLELASRGELEQVLDLANRYGADALGKSGFALQYVHGSIRYQEARAAHGGEAPTLDPAIGLLYQQAAQVLQAALDEPDASNFATPAASCRWLIAWCQYFRGEFLEARNAFELASQFLSGQEAAESLWMAIISFEKVAQTTSDPDTQSQLNALMDSFIERFPASPHAPTLRLRRTVSSQQVSESAVEELLAIPANSEVYDSAQRRAAEMLYQLFRGHRGSEKMFHGNRFLAVAVPLLSASARQVDAAVAGGAERFVVRCRQVLEVSLSEGVARADAARAAFLALEDARQAGQVDPAAIADEITCRRVQERLLEGDSAGAGTLADELWTRDSATVWSRLAVRAMFQHGYHLWKSGDSMVEQKQAGLEIVIRYGGRVLHEFKDTDNAVDQPGALGYHVAVAEASMTAWERTGDAERGNAALYLFEKLLAARPRNASFLRSTAVLSERLGDQAKALDCWRLLVAGVENGSDAWFEAKFHLIKILSATDPKRAREVMDQHKQFNPEYGPDPWGGMLKGLDAQLPAAPASQAVPQQSSAHDRPGWAARARSSPQLVASVNPHA